jgi:hypothetical protein
MHVIAFSTPSRPEWRWRLISYAGDIVEESREIFPCIADAIGAGAVRSEELRVRDSRESLPVYEDFGLAPRRRW